MKKNDIIKKSIFLISILVIIICVTLVFLRELNMEKKDEPKKEEIVNKIDFLSNIVKEVNKNNKKNSLISPYNMELALNMLRDGSSGNTKDEIDKVIGNRTINDISVKDKVGIANGVFIRDEYKDNVKNDYYNILKTKYNSDIIYDSFTSSDKINNWVKEKTNGMIDKILDQMDPDFVMGLASALAIDVKWKNEFDCNSTTSEEFTYLDNTKSNVEMMHKEYEYGARYIQNDEVDGIIIPYQKEDNVGVELEFVGLIPKNGIDNYIKSITSEKINDMINNSKEASDKVHINLSLPRFTYDYEVINFIDVLESIGIKEAFDPDKANFKNMIEIPNYNVYVGEAIHKTHIELNEAGTKAAAITYFGMYKNTSMIRDDFEKIDITFNKPFIYMIREKNTGEVLFFGSVYEPNKWTGTTCENK